MIAEGGMKCPGKNAVRERNADQAHRAEKQKGLPRPALRNAGKKRSGDRLRIAENSRRRKGMISSLRKSLIRYGEALRGPFFCDVFIGENFFSGQTVTRPF